MSRAPFVAMLTDLRKEERVRFTADFCGYNEDEALGKFFRLWSWCTDRGLDDSPDDCEGYAVADPVVRRFLGPRGVDGILGDGCDELAMGERRPDGLIYLRGTHETVSRLRTLRATAVAGGRSAADRAIKIGRGKGGRFVSEQTITPADGPAGHQPDTSRVQRDPTSHLPPPTSGIRSLTRRARDPTKPSTSTEPRASTCPRSACRKLLAPGQRCPGAGGASLVAHWRAAASRPVAGTSARLVPRAATAHPRGRRARRHRVRSRPDRPRRASAR